MTIEDQIKDEKLQYDINREAAKISELSSAKLDKYEYLTGEEILPSNQQQIIQQGEKQVVALESLKDSDKKLTAIKDFIPKENLNPEIINEIKRIEEIEKKVDRNRMVYKGTNDFRNFKTIRAFGNEIRNNVISLDTANIEQANLRSYIYDFTEKKTPQDPEKRKLRSDVLNSVTGLVNGREMVLTAFKSGIFQVSKESQEGKGLKILTPNQMLKRLPIAFAQVKAGNNSESLLNEIRQIVYSLYRSKEITKKVYNNIINSIKV